MLEAGRNEGALVAAALLHDVLEQTALTLNDLERDFGTRVSSLVDAVTNRPGDTSRDSVARAEAAGKDAVLLRICDRLDAIRRVDGRHPENRDDYIEAVRRHHLVMARRHFPEFSAELDRAIRQAKDRLK
jgi:(p)ppGpp synthase/HD superfamily hydrolase